MINCVKTGLNFRLRSGQEPLLQKGQALVEIIIMFPLFILIVVMIAWFSRIVLARVQLVTAARYGTDLIIYCPKFSADDVKKEITNMLCDKNIEGRRLIKERIKKMDVVINRFPEITAANACNVALITDKKTCSVDIWYEIKLSPWLKKITGDEGVIVSARSEVLAGTGAKH